RAVAVAEDCFGWYRSCHSIDRCADCVRRTGLQTERIQKRRRTVQRVRIAVPALWIGGAAMHRVRAGEPGVLRRIAAEYGIVQGAVPLLAGEFVGVSRSGDHLAAEGIVIRVLLQVASGVGHAADGAQVVGEKVEDGAAGVAAGNARAPEVDELPQQGAGEIGLGEHLSAAEPVQASVLHAVPQPVIDVVHAIVGLDAVLGVVGISKTAVAGQVASGVVAEAGVGDVIVAVNAELRAGSAALGHRRRQEIGVAVVSEGLSPAPLSGAALGGSGLDAVELVVSEVDRAIVVEVIADLRDVAVVHSAALVIAIAEAEN